MTSRLGRVVALGASIGVSMGASSVRHARAEPFPTSLTSTDVELTWSRSGTAEQCPPREVLVGLVHERLGYDPFAVHADTTIDVSLDGANGERVATIVMTSKGAPESSTRVIRSRAPTCEPLTDGVALSIAVLLDPDTALGITPPPPRASGAAPRHPPPRRKKAPPPPPYINPRASTLAVRPAVVVGLSPRVAPGLELAANAALAPPWSVQAGALWASETASSDGNYRFGSTLGFVGGCFVRSLPRHVSLETCADLWAGATHAFVLRRTPFAPGQRFVMAVSPTSTLAWRWSEGLLVETGIQALVPLNRIEFRATGRPDPIYSQLPVWTIAFVGFGAAF